jgi:pilus assembly protein CpaE
MAKRSILLAGVPSATEAVLRAQFPDADVRQLSGSARITREGMAELKAYAAVVWLEGVPDAAFRLMRDLDAAGVRVVAVGGQKDADLILRAMREGAKEFVVAGDEDALVNALRHQGKPPRAAGLGRVHLVFPAKGGVGATTIATNLAGAFQARGGRTCLVDLNLRMGDVHAFLDLADGYSLSDLVRNMARTDRALLDATLLRHSSGVHVLAQSHRLDEAENVDAAAVSSLLAFLRQHYATVVVDGLRSFDEVSVAAIDESDHILLVVTQDVPAVRDARRCVELFRRLGCTDKLRLVVNRFQRSEIDREVISDTVGLPVAAPVANDYRAVARCVNRGRLLLEEAPRTSVTRDVEALVTLLTDEDVALSRAKPSLLKRILPMRPSHAVD